MASIENVILNDDLDPRISTGVETVTFFDPFTGEKREIELGEANRKHFANHLEKLQKYVDASRVVEVVKPTRKIAAGKTDLTAVREWARANGFEVGDRGRIKADIVEAYNLAQEAIANPDTDEVAAGDAPVAAVEVTGLDSEGNDKVEVVETSDDAQDENAELIEFLKANMDKDGKVHAHSLADAPNV